MGVSVGKVIKTSLALWWKKYSAATALGILLGMAFPPFPLGFLAYFGLIPFIYWARLSSASEAFKKGYWWGFGFHTTGVFWIINSTILGGVSALLFLPVFSAVTLVLCRWFYREFGKIFLLLFPVIWTSVEYLRTLGVFAFPWLSIGNTQVYYTDLIQFAEYTGVHGIIFWICILNILIYLSVESVKRSRQQGAGVFNLRFAGLTAVIVIMILLPLRYGRYVLEEGSRMRDSVKVSLIQGHVDMNEKNRAEFREYNFNLYEELSMKAAADNPDLIVWPETATMSFVRFRRRDQNRLKNIVLKLKTPLLAGSPDAVLLEEGGHLAYNSAVLLNRHTENIEKQAQWYAKIRLVPFGEWFPYEDNLPLFQKIDLGQANFRPGANYKIMELERSTVNILPSGGEIHWDVRDTLKFNVAVCFESIFPDFVRKFRQMGSQFMVVVSNVNWFGRTTSLYQHALIGVLRAVENRMGIAHCSNSGISVIIDPYGRILQQSGVYTREVLTGDVYYHDKDSPSTFFTRHGDLTGNISLAVFLMLLVFSVIRKRILIKNIT